MKGRIGERAYIGRAILEERRRIGEALKELEILMKQFPETPILRPHRLQVGGVGVGVGVGVVVVIVAVVVAVLHGGPCRVGDLHHRLRYLYGLVTAHGARFLGP